MHEQTLFAHGKVILLSEKNRIKQIGEYNAKAYDNLTIRVKKGKKKAIEEYAKEQGQSINGFVNEAIDEKMERR